MNWNRAMSDDTSRQLEWFKAYVASGRAPRWTMAPADIHGFLTALAMAGPFLEENWTDWVWSGEQPVFASDDEEWNVLSDLLACEEQVRRNVGAYRMLPAAVLPQTADGRFVAADWADGFLQAIEANPSPWQSVSENAAESLAIVLAACHDNHDGDYQGLVGLDELDEINLHLRLICRLMQQEPERTSSELQAA
jgi:yecA family protein